MFYFHCLLCIQRCNLYLSLFLTLIDQSDATWIYLMAWRAFMHVCTLWKVLFRPFDFDAFASCSTVPRPYGYHNCLDMRYMSEMVLITHLHSILRCFIYFCETLYKILNSTLFLSVNSVKFYSTFSQLCCTGWSIEGSFQ